MKDMMEIRWHGRGGQGVVTAAQLLAQSALKENKYFQSFPEFGPERMGAPIRAFSRVSSEPISLFCNIDAPDVVIVLDPTLIGSVDLTDGLKEDGVIIVNTSVDSAKIRQMLGMKTGKVYMVDASKIAQEEIGRSIPNTPMLGALINVTGVLSLDTMVEHLDDSFGKKFSEKIVKGNINALTRAFKEVIEA